MSGVSEKMITERQCKIGISVGLALGVVLPILLIVTPFAYPFFTIPSGTATQDGIVHWIGIQTQMQKIAGILGTVGPLLLVGSWVLLKQA